MKSKLFLIVLFLGMINAMVFGQADTLKTEDLLAMSFEDLLNMDITTASKSQEKLSDAPGIISVLSKDEIERFGGITLKDLLERIPGLVSSSAYFTDRSMISSRGDQIKVNGSHVLVLINGRPIREVQEGGISSDVFEAFPVNIIERIEVIKGPGSVLYGTGAFSGVINIITSDADKTGGSVSVLGGIGGAYGANANVNVKSSELNLVVAGRYMKKADYEVDYHHPTVDTTLNVPDETMSAFLDLSFKGLRLMTSYNQWETRYFIRGNFGLNKWTKFFTNVGYGGDISKNWRSDINLTYTPTTLKASGFPFIERSSSDMVAEWTNFIKLNEKSKFIVGGLFNHLQGQEINWSTEPKQTSADDERSSFGIYAQMDYQLIKSLKLIGGVQVNKVQNIDIDIVPRAGIIWYPTEALHIKVLYGQAFRAPSINEVGLQHFTLHGDPDLLPEKVNNFDFSVGYQADKFQIKVNYFNSRQTNIVIADRSTTPGLYKNLGEFNIQGAELEGKYYINQQLFVSFSTLYQINEDQAGNENVSPISGISAKGGISYLSPKGLMVSLFDIYQGPLDDSFNATLNPDPKAYNLVNAYFNLDFVKLLKLNLKQSLSLFAEGKNLLNQQVWVPDWGGITGETIPLYPGTELLVGIKAMF